MPRKPTSKAQQRKIDSTLHAYWQGLAVEDYQEQLARKELGLDWNGARTVAQKWVQKCRTETRKVIRLNYQTIINHAKGKTTRDEANGQRSWVTIEEVRALIVYAAEMAARGWPLSHRRPKEHADEILRARLGPTFPGVGKRWTHRFVRRYSEFLATELATAREAIRGGAVNPTTLAAWFDDVLRPQSVDVDKENIYGSDEHSSNGMEGQRGYVIVARKAKGRAHQQAGGSRENITVIATICADGTALAPTVVFKGKGYQVSWGKQDNPLGASLGYSLRGWTNGEIGVAWIKEFDRLTKVKANGRPRLLILDGHNSHYTRKFLEYARTHNIRVICYPAHTTHILQGLDVVIFGPLKRALKEERDEWERTHEKMSKNNFLAIYAKAHLRVMTPHNIESAFRQTGVYPFNPNIIAPEHIAPSKETSSLPTLPLDPITPVRVLARLIGDLVVHEDLGGEDDDDDDDDDEAGWEDLPLEPFNPFKPLTPPHLQQPSSPSADVGNTPPEAHTPTLAPLTALPQSPRTPIRRPSLPLQSPTTPSRHPTTPRRHQPHRHVRVISPDVREAAGDHNGDGARTVIEEAMRRLGETKLERLITSFSSGDTTFRAPMQIPVVAARLSAPRRSAALAITPENEREASMLALIRDLEESNESYRRLLIEAQAVNILNQLYNAQLKEKLAQRDLKAKQKNTKGRLMGDGLPVVLTGDEFYQRVVEYEEEQQRRKDQRRARQVSRAEFAKAMEEYEKRKEAREEAWDERHRVWEQEKLQWVAEKVQWAKDKRAGKVRGRFDKKKPLLGKKPPAIPRPKLADITEDAPESDGEVFQAVSEGTTSEEEE